MMQFTDGTHDQLGVYLCVWLRTIIKSLLTLIVESTAQVLCLGNLWADVWTTCRPTWGAGQGAPADHFWRKHNLNSIRSKTHSVDY